MYVYTYATLMLCTDFISTYMEDDLWTVLLLNRIKNWQNYISIPGQICRKIYKNDGSIWLKIIFLGRKHLQLGLYITYRMENFISAGKSNLIQQSVGNGGLRFIARWQSLWDS